MSKYVTKEQKQLMNKIILALTTLLILPSLSQSCELNEKQVSCLQFIAAHRQKTIKEELFYN